jgi:predicted patatin/cPLA2 family phospholipase
LCIRLTIFNDIHQRTQTGNQYQHKQKVDDNLSETPLERAHQYVTLVDETKQLENAEDADEAERTQQHHISRIGQEVGKIRGQYRQQVNDAKKT